MKKLITYIFTGFIMLCIGVDFLIAPKKDLSSIFEVKSNQKPLFKKSKNYIKLRKYNFTSFLPWLGILSEEKA